MSKRGKILIASVLVLLAGAGAAAWLKSRARHARTPLQIASDPMSTEDELSAVFPVLPDGPATLRALLDRAKDPRWGVRRAAVARLGVVADPAATAAIEAAIGDTDSKVRRQAIESMAMVQDPSRAEALERAIRGLTPDPYEQISIASSRYRLSPSEKVQEAALGRLLEMARRHEDRAVRVEAAFKAMRVAPRNETVLRFLRQVADRADEPRLYGRALEHLVAVRDTWPIKNFGKLCMSPNPKYRDTALAVSGLPVPMQRRLAKRLVEDGVRRKECRSLARDLSAR